LVDDASESQQVPGVGNGHTGVAHEVTTSWKPAGPQVGTFRPLR
jgi:hypothetical protein